MRNLRWAAAGMLGLALTAPAALAQDISSPDALWRASLDGFDPSGGIGQITNLFTPASSTADNLFETLWYEATDGGLSTRVESTYTNTSSVIGADSAVFTALRNDGVFELSAAVTMVNGAGGGAQFALTYTNRDTVSHTHKAFAYADMDVDSTVTNDSMWNGSAVEQTGGTNVILFGNSQAYKAWDIETFATLRGDLDAGLANLDSSGGGLQADWTAAISGEEISLAPGESYTFRFSFAATPAPGALALMGLAGLVGTRRRRR